jgi:hypothetical protein
MMNEDDDGEGEEMGESESGSESSNLAIEQD